MPISSIRALVDAGVHFGHRASRWNPKMAPFIHSKRNLIHIIDLKETLRGLVRARHFLTNIAATGGTVLFVGTKRQAKAIVEEVAKDCGMPGVSERWLGGTLTNYATIRSRLARLEEIESMEKTGEIERFSKKMISALMREKRKLLRNLEGIRTLNRMPAALVVVDPGHEEIAVKEGHKLDIPVIALIDTDSDPTLVDIPIPCNDDAMRSVQILLAELGAAVKEGAKKYAAGAGERIKAKKEAAAAAPAGAGPDAGRRPARKRPRRSATRRRGKPRPGAKGRPVAQQGKTAPPAPPAKEAETAAKPAESKPEQAKPEQAKPEQAKPQTAEETVATEVKVEPAAPAPEARPTPAAPAPEAEEKKDTEERNKTE